MPNIHQLIKKAQSGLAVDIDYIMNNLTSDSTFKETRNIDFALSQVKTEEGKRRIEFYLYHGSQIQRNYACLFLSRIYEYEAVNKAFRLGLIDEIQAFSR